MILDINENIKIWREFNPAELALDKGDLATFDSKRTLARLGFNKERVAIKDQWFDVLTLSDLVRERNKVDGYYRALYIQINMNSGEYYIGKVNRSKWSELKRYHGSGLKFANKFKNSKEHFVRYYIASCATAEETEQLEASIVTSDLLADDKCLNLVGGGGGTSKHPSIAEASEKKRQYMKNHPEQFRPMLEAAKKAFRSGDTPLLRARNHRIKEVMSSEKFRKMTAARLKNWKEKNPLMYAASRRKNLEAIKTPECRVKRTVNRKKWIKDNPEKHLVWERNRLAALKGRESREKRKASLKDWKDQNPEQARINAYSRAKAAAAKLSKEVCMLDLHSGEILKRFQSQHEAAKWLVGNGKAKNTNCVSSISAVCLRKPCINGGFRKKAHGYGWRFSDFQNTQRDIRTNFQLEFANLEF